MVLNKKCFFLVMIIYVSFKLNFFDIIIKSCSIISINISIM